jgi:hypothetical protein
VEYGENGIADKKAHSVTDGLVNAYNRIHSGYPAISKSIYQE